MARSQSLREKKARWNVIGSYVIGATGQLLLSHGLLNTSGFDVQTGSQSQTETSYLSMGEGGVSREREGQVNERILPACHDLISIHSMSHRSDTIPSPLKLA